MKGEGMQTYRKAVLAAVIPVLVALVMWRLSGELNAPEFALALTGLLNAVAVYEVPNAGLVTPRGEG